MAVMGLPRGKGLEAEARSAAAWVAREYVGLPEAYYLEACNDCGVCSPSCPWYEALGRRYAPMLKAEGYRRPYRRVATFSGMILGGLVGARLPKSREDLEELLDIAYRCSNCGLCLESCPHGVDSGVVISLLRAFLLKLGVSPSLFKELGSLELDILAGRRGGGDAEAALDELKREYSSRRGPLVLIDSYQATVALDEARAYLELLSRAGIEFRLPEKPLGVRPPFGYVNGDLAGAREAAERIYKAAAENGGGQLIILDGGYQYDALRYSYTFYKAEKPRGLRVRHVAEVLIERVASGHLQIGKAGTATYVASCHADTRGKLRAGAKLVELAASEAHLPGKSRFSGPGAMAMALPGIAEKLAAALGLKSWMDESVEKLAADVEEVSVLLAAHAAMSGPPAHVFVCNDDLVAVKVGAEKRGLEVEPQHLSQFLLERA